MLNNTDQKPASEVRNSHKRAIQVSQRSQRTYGKRKVGGKTVEHKREWRAVSAIGKMYGEGISTNAIARFLDALLLKQHLGFTNSPMFHLRKYI